MWTLDQRPARFGTVPGATKPGRIDHSRIARAADRLLITQLALLSGQIHELRERLRIVDRHLGQHLAIDGYLCSLETCD